MTLQELCGTDDPRSVTTIKVRGTPKLGPDAMRTLASAPFDALTSLDVSGHPIGDEGLAALAAAPWAPRIAQLNVGHCQIGPEGARSLARFRALRDLAVFGNAISEEGMLGVASLPSLRRAVLNNNGIGSRGLNAVSSLLELEHLGLMGNPIECAGVEALLTCPAARSLATLDVSECALGDAGALALASAELPALTALHAWKNEIGPSGAAAIASARWSERLLELTLSSNPICDALAGARLAGLERLGISGVDLGDGGASRLGAARWLPQLTFAQLDANEIGDVGMKALVDGGLLTRMSELFLGRNSLGDESATLLARNMPAALTVLWMDACQIRDAGARAIAAALRGRVGVELVMDTNPFSAAARDELLAAVPDAVV